MAKEYSWSRSIYRGRHSLRRSETPRTEESRQVFREMQRKVKVEVAKAKKGQTINYILEGETDFNRSVGQRDRDGKDLQQVRMMEIFGQVPDI